MQNFTGTYCAALDFIGTYRASLGIIGTYRASLGPIETYCACLEPIGTYCRCPKKTTTKTKTKKTFLSEKHGFLEPATDRPILIFFLIDQLDNGKPDIHI